MPPDKQSLHMKILRATFVSCGGASFVNQHFQILNLVDHGWKESEGKLEPNLSEGPAHSSIEDINQQQNNLDPLPDVSESTENIYSVLEDENEGICLSYSIDDEEPYWALC